jgi:hypothetical protein
MKTIISVGVIASVLSIVFGLAGCSASKEKTTAEREGEVVHQRTTYRTVHWRLVGAPSGKFIRIASDVGYCDGVRPPSIHTVHSDERKEDVLLTAVLAAPKQDPGVACAGVRLGLEKTVMLKRALDDRSIFDASFSPPRMRWPR